MPGYQTHLAGGAIVFAAVLVCVVPYAHPTVLITGEWLLFSLAGSLFPDIDPDIGDEVILNYNPLNEISVNTYIPQLEARGVIVYY